MWGGGGADLPPGCFFATVQKLLASEAERTIGFRQPGDPTIQTEVAHQSNLSMSAGNQVWINIGNSPEHTWRNIFKTSSSNMQIMMTQSIFYIRICSEPLNFSIIQLVIISVGYHY